MFGNIANLAENRKANSTTPKLIKLPTSNFFLKLEPRQYMMNMQRILNTTLTQISDTTVTVLLLFYLFSWKLKIILLKMSLKPPQKRRLCSLPILYNNCFEAKFLPQVNVSKHYAFIYKETNIKKDLKACQKWHYLSLLLYY